MNLPRRTFLKSLFSGIALACFGNKLIPNTTAATPVIPAIPHKSNIFVSKGLRDALQNGVIRFYSGKQPDLPDGEEGRLLGTIENGFQLVDLYEEPLNWTKGTYIKMKEQK